MYFREHPGHAVYVIFGLIPIAMSLPAWITAKFGILSVSHGLGDSFTVMK